MATTDFVDAKAYLTKDYRGTHLYNHLTEVILKLPNDRPADALTVLENQSHDLNVSDTNNYCAWHGRWDFHQALSVNHLNLRGWLPIILL